MTFTRPRTGWLAFLLLAVLAYRLGYVVLTGLPLYGDEAQYYTWALRPDWGYYSKPPMTAWAIAVFTAVCGGSEPCIKLPAIVLYGASAGCLFLLGRRLFDAETGMWAAVVFLTLPLTSLLTLFMSADAPLLFFWAGALLFTVRALESGRVVDWVGLGICLGFGALSKYSVALFLLPLLLILWRHRPNPLRAPGPWVAALTAVVIVLPNLAWNLEHQFATFQHTADISQIDRATRGRPLEFALSQVAVMGPVLFVLLLVASWRWPRAGPLDSARFTVLTFTWTPLVFFLGLAALSRANANWSAPAFVAGSLAVAAWAMQANRKRWLVAGVCVNLAIMLAIHHHVPVLAAMGIGPSARTDAFKKIRGWRELGALVRPELDAMPGTVLATEGRMELALLAYYTGRANGGFVVWNPGKRPTNHYRMFFDANTAKGRDFLIVTKSPDIGVYLPHFENGRELNPAHIAVYPDWSLDFHVYRLEKFRGY